MEINLSRRMASFRASHFLKCPRSKLIKRGIFTCYNKELIKEYGRGLGGGGGGRGAKWEQVINF